MRAGLLKRIVTIERAVDAQDGTTGAMDRSWVPFASMWARIEPLRGKEYFAADAVQAEVDTRITVRWNNAVGDIVERDRVQHQGTIYNIVSVIHVEAGRREVQLMCRSGVNDG